MRIVVTGAAGGIGREIVHQLSEAGHILLCSDISPDMPAPSRVDVTDEAQVAGLFDQAGGVDAVIHAAGLGVFKPFCELTASDWRSMLEANVLGAFLVSRAAARTMSQSGGGRIIHFGSVANARALDGSAGYGASKAALEMICRSMNHELSGAGIRTTFLTLGAVYTPIWEGRAGYSASDMLSVADVAAAVKGIVESPLHVRIDEMTLLPPKGIL